MSRHFLALCAAGAFVLSACPANAQIEGIPRYEHIIVIIAENHGFDQIKDNANAPNINTLAQKFGLATQYFGVVHPSKANYIAMIAGKTFGIHDDKPHVDHTISDRSLVDQLKERNLTWKGYYENFPADDPRAVFSPKQGNPLYVSKHNAFINFKNVQDDPAFADKIVGLDRLSPDLANGQFPNYAHIIPNLCNDMHGMDPGAGVDKNCEFDDTADTGIIARGDKVIGDLVAKIIASPVWSKPGNVAIVITWDENEDGHNVKGKGCCGFDPNSPANFGGGHVPTIVVTNNGPRGVTDDTPHNHYSLLRTTEAAFGITEHLNLANHPDVHTMVKLFAVP